MKRIAVIIGCLGVLVHTALGQMARPAGGGPVRGYPAPPYS